MLPSNDTKAETARQIHSSILRAVADAIQKGCADSLDMSEGNFSKWLAGDTGIRIENLCELLAFLNLGLTGSAGALAATQRHLEDMRKLVFGDGKPLNFSRP